MSSECTRATAASSAPAPVCVVVGANASYQKILTLDQLDIGGVNRAASACRVASGKGQNFARGFNRATGQAGSCVCAHFLGGDTGRWIHDQLNLEGIPQAVSWLSKGDTRTCTTLRCTGESDASSQISTTELIEPAARVTDIEAARLIHAVLKLLHGSHSAPSPAGSALTAPTPMPAAAAKQAVPSPPASSTWKHPAGLALCGTCPPGTHPVSCDGIDTCTHGGFYSTIVAAKPRHCTCLLDCSTPDIVEACLSTGCVDILKVAAYELLALVPATEEGATAATLTAQKARVHKLQHAALKIMSQRQARSGDEDMRGRLRWLAVTDGASSAYLFEHRRTRESAHTRVTSGTVPSPGAVSAVSCWRLDIQPLDKKQLRQGNPIGAGDTVAAVLLAKYLSGHDMLDAFRWGIAAGSAKCMMPGSGGEYREEDMQVCYDAICLHEETLYE